MTITPTNAQNILAIDCGQVTTTVLLITLVEGRYELNAAGQAPSTHESPWHNLLIGVQAAVRHIEQATRQTLLDIQGNLITPRSVDRQGVDACIIVSSASTPLPIHLLGATQDLSVNSAKRAIQTTYTNITQNIALDAPFSVQSGESRLEAHLKSLHQNQLNTLVLVGGVDGGTQQPITEMAKVLAMRIKEVMASPQPQIFFAGNVDAQPKVIEVLQHFARVTLVDNVRPTLEIENLRPLQQAIEQVYIQHQVERLPGLEPLQQWSNHPIVPTSRSLEQIVTYLGQYHNQNVATIDLGSQSTILATQAQQENFPIIVRTDIGLGHSLGTLLQQLPLEQIQRWLPFAIPLDILRNFLFNLSLYPASLPSDEQDLTIINAVAREAIRLIVEQGSTHWQGLGRKGHYAIQWQSIIGAGRTLTQNPKLAQSLMTLLDGFQPWGVTKIGLDVNNVMNIAGSLATIHPKAAVEIIEHPQTFLKLGTVIAPVGHAPGKKALNLRVLDGDEVLEELDVPYGQLSVVPLPNTRKFMVEMRPTAQFDIGLGEFGRGAVSEIEGGLFGLIIDTRGRPLRLPDNADKRHEQLNQWANALNGQQVGVV